MRRVKLKRESRLFENLVYLLAFQCQVFAEMLMFVKTLALLFLTNFMLFIKVGMSVLQERILANSIYFGNLYVSIEVFG